MNSIEESFADKEQRSHQHLLEVPSEWFRMENGQPTRPPGLAQNIGAFVCLASPTVQLSVQLSAVFPELHHDDPLTTEFPSHQPKADRTLMILPNIFQVGRRMGAFLQDLQHQLFIHGSVLKVGEVTVVSIHDEREYISLELADVQMEN